MLFLGLSSSDQYVHNCNIKFHRKYKSTLCLKQFLSISLWLQSTCLCVPRPPFTSATAHRHRVLQHTSGSLMTSLYTYSTITQKTKVCCKKNASSNCYSFFILDCFKQVQINNLPQTLGEAHGRSVFIGLNVSAAFEVIHNSKWSKLGYFGLWRIQFSVCLGIADVWQQNLKSTLKKSEPESATSSTSWQTIVLYLICSLQCQKTECVCTSCLILSHSSEPGFSVTV